MAQQGASLSNAALKADANTKPKPKAKTELWCDFHKSITHNMSDYQILKEQKNGKRKKVKK